MYSQFEFAEVQRCFRIGCGVRREEFGCPDDLMGKHGDHLFHLQKTKGVFLLLCSFFMEVGRLHKVFSKLYANKTLFVDTWDSADVIMSSTLLMTVVCV